MERIKYEKYIFLFIELRDCGKEKLIKIEQIQNMLKTMYYWFSGYTQQLLHSPVQMAEVDSTCQFGNTMQCKC